MKGRLGRIACELAIRMLARGALPAEPGMQDLLRRGLACHARPRRDGSTHARGAAESLYELTPLGAQIAEKLSRRRVGHDLCWVL